jgi:hypothetical protein
MGSVHYDFASIFPNWLGNRSSFLSIKLPPDNENLIIQRAPQFFARFRWVINGNLMNQIPLAAWHI